MSLEDKASNKLRELKGKAMEVTGKTVGSGRMEADGRAEQARADVGQNGDRVKDLFD
ncbi:CsbD family protein [Actinomadura flavalba]|uniref:CsbD family protein n=1 Tax=Actinomadura flavalba TaxID=1120938 RepID=UPI000371644F|nr:CsbD family protein [Actinomadura flavalba]